MVLDARQIFLAVIPAQAGIHFDLAVDKENGSRPAPG
jgi:hypothetical protein